MKSSLQRAGSPRSFLAQLIAAPDLVQTVRALPALAFSALIRHVGVEDAGELVALATTEQLVTAFDEDLFVNTRPGHRETFDVARFAVWLEVLLEAGDEVAAHRVSELSEDFVVQAISRLIVVLDHDALLSRMSEGGREADYADKAIESALSEEIDGYLLLSRQYDGWDAVLALILALDRNQRDFLERILSRCAALASVYLDDLSALTGVLSAEDSLSEDVEAAREDRRSQQGYVEPRAARAFLTLAKQAVASDRRWSERDPMTMAYFRDVARSSAALPKAVTPVELASPKLMDLLAEVGVVHRTPSRALLGEVASASTSAQSPLLAALQLLCEQKPECFLQRMEELAYLSNVLVAGASNKGERFRAAEAAEAVLVTCCLGAQLVFEERSDARDSGSQPVTAQALCQVLKAYGADLLFRRASSMLATHHPSSPGYLRSAAELDELLK